MGNNKIEPDTNYKSDVMMTSEDDVIDDTYTVIPRIYLDDARHRSQEFERYISRQQKYPKECIPNFKKKNQKNFQKISIKFQKNKDFAKKIECNDRI